MLWIERVKALARVCQDYMTEYNKIDNEGHEYAQRIDNGDLMLIQVILKSWIKEEQP